MFKITLRIKADFSIRKMMLRKAVYYCENFAGAMYLIEALGIVCEDYSIAFGTTSIDDRGVRVFKATQNFTPLTWKDYIRKATLEGDVVQKEIF